MRCQLVMLPCGIHAQHATGHKNIYVEHGICKRGGLRKHSGAKAEQFAGLDFLQGLVILVGAHVFANHEAFGVANFFSVVFGHISDIIKLRQFCKYAVENLILQETLFRSFPAFCLNFVCF